MKITADDDSYEQAGYDKNKHAVKIECFISSEQLSEEVVKNSAFEEYTKPFDISVDGKYVVYVKLTDHAGNVSYASTDGFAIDTTSPIVEVYTYDNDHTERYTNGQRVEVCGDTQFEFIDENFDVAYVIIDGKKWAIWGNSYSVSVWETGRIERWITFEVHDKVGNVSTIDVYVHKDHSFNEETGVCDYCGYQATVLIKCSNDNNEVKFVAGDSFDKTLSKASIQMKFNRFYLKLYGNVERIAKVGSYGSSDKTEKMTYDLNGYTFSNPPGVDPNSLAALFEVAGNITIVGKGAMNVDIMTSGGSLTIDDECTFKNLIHKHGTLTVNAGSFESLTISKPDVTWSYTRETELCGGYYGDIKIVDIEGLTCADLLGKGYRYDGISYDDAKVTELKNVTVVPCEHANVGSDNICPDCGMEFFLSIETNGTKKLFDTFENAVRYAEQNDGCTIKLLQDLTLDEKTAGSLINDHKIELTKGKYTIDLNGKTLYIGNENNDFDALKVCDGCDVTITDTVGGGKVKSSGAVLEVRSESHLTIERGDYTELSKVLVNGPGSLTIKGGKFKRIESEKSSNSVSPLTYLADGCAFMLYNEDKYANENNVDSKYISGKGTTYSIENVTAVNAPLVFNGQPRDKTYYLTMPNYEKWAVFTFLYSGGYPSKGDITVTGERTDGMVVYTNTIKPTRIYQDGINLWEFTKEDSGQFRVKLEYNGYVLYSNTFTITMAECEHPGYYKDYGYKCSQCECDLVAVITNGDKTMGYVTFAEALAAAQTDENIACSLVPFVDVNENISVTSGAFTLEATNILLDGKLDVSNGAGLTVNCGMITKNVTCAKGGMLEIIAGTYKGIVTGESGSSLIISGGSFTEINIAGKQLVDCLKDGYAFSDIDTDKIIDGRVNNASNVKVVSHTHNCVWDTADHEKRCACGYVEDIDNEAPIISGVNNGKTYYSAVEFSVSDKNDFTVTVDGKEVRLTLGSYIIEPDNDAHTITATDVAGNTSSVTIIVNKLYHVTLRSGTGYTLIGEPLVGYGMDYTFTLEIAEGYSKTDNFMVDVNGAPMRSDSNSYTVPLVTSDIVVTVFGIADITPPHAEIEIGTNKFNSFMNTITFGLFFKKTQTITVTAADTGSGLSKVEYLLSETAFADKDAVTGDWTELTLSDGKASFDIEPNKKAYVYLRVTDASGNVQVINSDGMVAYTDSEAITKAVSFTMLEKSDVSFAVKLNGNTINAVRNGDMMLAYDRDYTISEDGTITLKNSYLSTLVAGEYTIRVTYNPLGEEYKTGDEPAMTSVKLTVEKITPELNLEPKTQKIYDGEPIDYRTINSSINAGSVSVWEYKPLDADDSAYSTTAPKNAGKYSVRLTTKEDDNFKEASAEVTYEITPREVTISDTTVKSSKVYDGNTNAEITSGGKVNGLVEKDNVTVVAGKATYSDRNVGNDKTVTFSGFSLAGDDVANYMLSAQPANITANITPKELTITELKVKDKQYDGKDTAEIDGTPALVGVVKGDELKLVNGTPAFDSVKVGKNIPISFTMFTLAGDSTITGNYILKQPTGIMADIVEYVANGSEYSVNSNDWLNTDFVITAKSGYKLSLTDTAEGEWSDTLIASDETDSGKLTFYVKNTSTGVISLAITENYKIDKNPPTGEVKLNEQTAFQDLIDKINFALLFKNDVNVKLTATDDASGVKSVRYFKFDRILSDDEVREITDWTESSDFDIKAKDMDKFVIYVRIEDNAGNVTYIGSDGATFDTAAPKIIGAENGKTYYLTSKIAIHDENLESATLNGEPVENEFTLTGDTDATYVIHAVDKVGNVTEYTVYMKPISSITNAIAAITADNVRSSDEDKISAVERQILDVIETLDDSGATEFEKTKLTEASAKCKELNKRINDVANEIIRLTDSVNGYNIDKVTSDNKSDVEKLVNDIDSLLGGDNLTDTERALLEKLRETAQTLLERIGAARSAIEADEITAVSGITKDNAKFEDKEALEKAEKALEDALHDFDGNYTEDERRELETKLDIVKSALSAISDLERAEEVTNSPKTGAVSELAPWIVLLFISGGIVSGATVANKKKKRMEK